MSEWQPIGDVLNELGVKIKLDPTDRVVEVLVIAKIVDLAEEDAVPILGVYGSEGSDWISQRGLLHSALEVKGTVKPEGVE
jgi:hypothetical protein